MFSEIFLPITLALIMFGVGMSLTFRDFRRILSYPKSLFIGLLCQMIVFPAIAFGIALLAGPILGVSGGVQAGLVLVALCPGGTTANLVCYLLKTNVALAILLTAANSLLVLVTIPILLEVNMELFLPSTQASDPLPKGEIIWELVMLVLLPTLVGVSVRQFRRPLADFLERYMRYLLPAMMGIAFAGVILLDDGESGEGIQWQAVPPILALGIILNTAGIAMGFYLPRPMGLKKRNRLTVGIQVGLQNIGLALLIAQNMLHEQQMAEVAVVYGAFTFFSTLGGAWLLRKYAN